MIKVVLAGALAVVGVAILAVGLIMDSPDADGVASGNTALVERVAKLEAEVTRLRATVAELQQMQERERAVLRQMN
jgi:hypothetical protein